MLEIRDVRIDDRGEGCITDNPVPVLSFALFSSVSDTFLSSAVISVDGREILTTGEQTGIRLTSLFLKPFTVHIVTVDATDNHGERASSTLGFSTARMGTVWTADWITDSGCVVRGKGSPVPMVFRKDFSTEGRIRRAYITATALGIFEISLNGGRVGSDFFAPGFTSYRKNLQYRCYDVTAMLQRDNGITVTVAGGWAVGRFTYENRNRITFPRQALLLELFIEYEDGRREIIRSDGTWDVTTQGPVRAACFYDGETYDAALDSSCSLWKKADVIRIPFSPVFTLSRSFVVERHIFSAASHFTSSDGSIIYDFGQNAAGVVCLKVCGRKGQVITIRHAECLENGSLYTKSLRTATAEVKYICRDGLQTYMPHFTYMGFRYISVEGADENDIEVSFHTLSSDNERTLSFSCSDSRLNRLQENIVWSAESNFVDIPTDCPQRDERMGWTGDAAVFAETACFNYDLSRFWKKWLFDMRLEQGRGGGIPTVVPLHGCSTPVSAVALWGDSVIMVPYAEYLARGDINLLKEMYPSMKKYMKAVSFWVSFSGFGKRRYIWKWLYQFGDWCAPYGNVRDWMKKGKWTATCFYAHSASLLSSIAGILGEKDDGRHYRELSEKVTDAFNSLLTDGKGRIRDEFQTGYVLPLSFGMESGENRKRMADNLERLVGENGFHLSTGFPGTPYILFALADNEHADTAYRLLLQDTCPSWLYMIEKGATTLWEQWNAITPSGEVREPSMNHYAYGAVGAFLYRRVLGLEPIEGGWRKFRLRPLPGGNLTHVEGSVSTPYGLIKASWRIGNGKFKLDVKVPVSAECTVIMPDGKEIKVTSGTHSFEGEMRK